jgi:hypothetical protein
MVRNTGKHYNKHILTGYFADRLLLWDKNMRESALRCLCRIPLL